MAGGPRGLGPLDRLGLVAPAAGELVAQEAEVVRDEGEQVRLLVPPRPRRGPAPRPGPDRELLRVRAEVGEPELAQLAPEVSAVVLAQVGRERGPRLRVREERGERA